MCICSNCFWRCILKKNGSLTREELALLLSVYDRRGRHNDDVADGMYEKLYPVL